MNSLLFGDGPTSREIAWMRKRRLNENALLWGPLVVYRACKRSFLPPTVELDPALDADFWCAFQRESVRRHLIDMCSAYESSFSKLESTYASVRCKTLALWAERDAHFPPVHAERLARCVPNATVSVLHGEAHWMALTAPRRVAGELSSFFHPREIP
jgi:pimeloyl-ACP methyl ester carboxylesterase